MKKIRFFLGFFDKQEKWLNRMVKDGWRLIKISWFVYEFEKCFPNEYIYCVDCTVSKTEKEYMDYRTFLEEMGYTILYTRLNLNLAFGKFRWRLGGSSVGHIDSSFKKLNNEVLIIEKMNDQKPFAIYTSAEDMNRYYRGLRNAYLPAFILGLLVLISRVMSYTSIESLYSIKTILMFIFVLILLIPMILYQRVISRIED